MRCRRESVHSSKAEFKLIANSGRTPPPLSPGSAVARILLPTGTAVWVRGVVFPMANIVPGSRKLFQGRYIQCSAGRSVRQARQRDYATRSARCRTHEARPELHKIASKRLNTRCGTQENGSRPPHRARAEGPAALLPRIGG